MVILCFEIQLDTTDIVLNVGYHYKLMILFNDGEITTEIAALLL
jgi:hypothetical protein